MYKSTELLETRAKLIANAKVIIESAEADARDLSEEEQAQVDGMFAQADEAAVQAEEAASAERKAKLAELEASTRKVSTRKVSNNARWSKAAPGREEMSEAFRMWALAGSPESRLNNDQIFKLNELGFNPHNRTLNLRALAKTTSNAPVPADFTAEYEKKLKHYFGVLDAVTAFSTTDGRDLPFTVVDDTSNAAAIVGEASSIAVNVDPSFSKVTFKSWKYASPTVKVSVELLQDSTLDLQSYLSEAFAERFGRAYETAVVSTNAGSAAPEGILYGVSVGANLATGNAITLAKLIDLEVSVDIAYRTLPGSGWLMHDATWARIRQLADDDNLPIFLGDLHEGTAPRLLGYPVFISNQMTSIASPGGDDPLIAFGAMNKYRWRTCSDRVMTRLDELYAATGEVGFVMLERVDGRYLNKDGVKTLNSFDAP